MRSIALWSSPEISAKEKPAQVHINLWKLPENNGYRRFIDIGVRLEETVSMESFNIYIPAVIENENVYDITGCFISDPSLINAVFNENYSISIIPNKKIHPVKDENTNTVFHVYQLASSDIILENKYGGTIIKIILPHINDKIYFRIRITGKYLQSLSTIQKPSNSFVQSAFSKNELIDFRINEARDLDKSLLEKINVEQNYTFNKIHFFFVCSSNEDITNSHTPFLNCRNLEKNLWNKYIGSPYDDDGGIILAYHWKGTDRKDYNVLIKSKFEENNWSTILAYLLILFIITLAFNVISSYVYDYLKQCF